MPASQKQLCVLAGEEPEMAKLAITCLQLLLVDAVREKEHRRQVGDWIRTLEEG